MKVVTLFQKQGSNQVKLFYLLCQVSTAATSCGGMELEVNLVQVPVVNVAATRLIVSLATIQLLD